MGKSFGTKDVVNAETRRVIFTLAGGSRPRDRYQECDRNTQRDLDKAMHGDDPGWTDVSDQQDDAQRDGGKTVGSPDPQYGGENSANEDASAIDEPTRMEIGGDQRAHHRTQGGSHESLPG
jgi:hypothetical protein